MKRYLRALWFVMVVFLMGAGTLVYEAHGAEKKNTKLLKAEKTPKPKKKVKEPKKKTNKKVPKDDTGLTPEELENIRDAFNTLTGWERLEILRPGRYEGGINRIYPEEDDSLIEVVYPNSHSDVFYFGSTYDLTWRYNGDGEPPAHFDVSLVDHEGHEIALELEYRWNPETRTCNALWDVPTWRDRELPIYTGEYKIKVSAGEESDMSNNTFFLTDIDLTVRFAVQIPRTGTELVIRWDVLTTGFMLYGVGFELWEAELISCSTGERAFRIIYPDFQRVTDLGLRSNGRQSYEYRWRLGAYPQWRNYGARPDGTYDIRMEWGGWDTANIDPGYYVVRLWPAGKIVSEIHIDSAPFYVGGNCGR